MLKELSLSALAAGLVAVLVSYAGPLAIFFQAARSADISTAMMTSWVWAVSIGAAVTSIGLSAWFRIPVVTAWSAPGTASICTSVDAHEDPGRRYIAGIANGVFYLIGGLFAGTIVLFFSIFPAQMIAMLAGLALIGAIASSLQVAFAERERMEAPLIAFMVTASGLEVFDIGAAFWGVAIGSVAHLMLHRSGLAGAGEPKGIV